MTVWDPRRELAYRGPFPADGDAHVTWTLEPLDDGAATRLVLVHTALPVELGRRVRQRVALLPRPARSVPRR